MKIFDTFTFFNELDLLEIRLNILDPYVDFFVLVESTETFSGKEKPLYYEENKERFAKWSHKIIHHVVPKGEFPNSFERAGFQKDSVREVLNHWAKDEDIVYFGDLDEIWRNKIKADDEVYSLRQTNYCYFLNNRSSEEWIGTFVGKWGTVKTNTVNYWRATHTRILDNEGWHFTNMGGADQIRKKLEAYDHVEFDRPEIKADIEKKMEAGEDYVGRRWDWKGMPFRMWVDEIDLPPYLRDNKEKWIKLFR